MCSIRYDTTLQREGIVAGLLLTDPNIAVGVMDTPIQLNLSTFFRPFFLKYRM